MTRSRKGACPPARVWNSTGRKGQERSIAPEWRSPFEASLLPGAGGTHSAPLKSLSKHRYFENLRSKYAIILSARVQDNSMYSLTHFAYLADWRDHKREHLIGAFDVLLPVVPKRLPLPQRRHTLPIDPPRAVSRLPRHRACPVRLRWRQIRVVADARGRGGCHDAHGAAGNHHRRLDREHERDQDRRGSPLGRRLHQGATVRTGQPLYQIDLRAYRAARNQRAA
ncbi:hypothetical protein QE385_000099 [Sphingomonas sp. SORGH_AS 950]|nr:hypothetical protein [Sphingomonas sp. SORGH_AS_0950]